MLKRVWAACLAAAFLIPAASAAAPVLTQKDQCASCEMWITKYPGPKGAVQLTDGTVLKYCSARGAACGWTKAWDLRLRHLQTRPRPKHFKKSTAARSIASMS